MASAEAAIRRLCTAYASCFVASSECARGRAAIDSRRGWQRGSTTPIRWIGNGKLQADLKAAPAGVARAGGAAVRPHHALHDREAQTVTFGRLGVDAAEERPKRLRQFRPRHARTVIPYREVSLRSNNAHSDIDDAPGGLNFNALGSKLSIARSGSAALPTTVTASHRSNRRTICRATASSCARNTHPCTTAFRSTHCCSAPGSPLSMRDRASICPSIWSRPATSRSACAKYGAASFGLLDWVRSNANCNRANGERSSCERSCNTLRLCVTKASMRSAMTSKSPASRASSSRPGFPGRPTHTDSSPRAMR